MATIRRRLDKVEKQENDKRFDEAEDICSRYITRKTVSTQFVVNSKYKDKTKKTHEEELSQWATELRKKIKYAQIGEIILKMLSSDVDSEILYNTVKERIKRNNLNLSLVKLGKTKDGLKTITLKDIWPQEKVR